MIRPIFILLCCISVSAFTQISPLYLNTSEPVEKRVENLVSLMTLEEKIGQMVYNAPSIERLGVPEYNWWNEGLHGVARSGKATIFPQAIGLGATFDTSLVFQIATAISDEARAMYRVAIANGNRLQYSGLTFWSPNINIFRDPRWGRGQETYGEDPYLTSRIGAAYVKGLQGNNPQYLKTAACAKHFAVHSGPEKLRHEFNAIASEKDLNETYLPAFKNLADAGVEAFMCAYNRTNDEPCCASNYLLIEKLRSEWGFKGHVVSDCWAITDFFQGHKVTADEAESAALAVKHGVNLECGDVYPALKEAINRGLITETEIDNALKVLFTTRFKLGLFDPDSLNPFMSVSENVIDSKEHRQLAYEAAVKSVVMLKNSGVLPLKNNFPKYFVTGPLAANIEAILGNYHGVNDNLVTVLEGITSRIATGSQVQYRQGCLLDRKNANPIDWSSGNARSSDATIVVLGISSLIEGEEGDAIASSFYGDRDNYNLPENQVEYLKALRNGHTNPIITIIMGGSPINLEEVYQLSDAVLFAWYPGEEGGNAVADIIFGNVSPSAKLPITFPKSYSDLPPFEDYSMSGRTYKYMEKDPLFPFGFGLSYSQFEYSDIKLSNKKIKKNQPVFIEFTVTNKGGYNSDEVVQIYLTPPQQENFSVPNFDLKHFQRIHLKPGESQTVKLALTPEMLKVFDNEGNMVLLPGKFLVSVGGSLPIKQSLKLGSPVYKSIEFEITK